ncbi:MAG: hypothetical protein K2K49_02675 [Duncaniella sp.]|nr:hypothetical protein [Duncaniella sp.]
MSHLPRLVAILPEGRETFLITILVMVCIILLLAFLDQKLNNALLYDRIAEVAQSKAEMADARITETVAPLLSQYIDRVTAQYTLLSTLPTGSPEASAAQSRVRNDLSSLSSPETREVIIKAVDETRDRIITTLDREFPRLKSEDRLVFALNACDVPSRVIALFLDVDVSGYYSRRKRLVKRIKNSSSPDRDILISILN